MLTNNQGFSFHILNSVSVANISITTENINDYTGSILYVINKKDISLQMIPFCLLFFNILYSLFFFAM